eukprot:TRINITY_DN12475_c1_g2_i2.p1 TRINITY_DN12475_c1_g2~~TRINITY_DN12475_c1_g2_i2.p1  ORF type:complete len:299 (+),score=54.83 TRINITY_DN12475_c1_g2_i2:3-899(+)
MNMKGLPFTFGWVPSKDKETIDYFQVSRFPLIAMAYLSPEYSDGKESDDKQMGMAISPYPGPLKYKSMFTFFSTIAQDTEREIQGKVDGMTANLATKRLQEVSNQEDFDNGCINAGGICVIGLLDKKSPEYEMNWSILQMVANARVNNPLQFVVVDAATQPQFIDSFQVSLTHLPTVVAYSPRKERFGVLFSTFTDEHINELLDGILKGSISTTPTLSTPLIVDGGVVQQNEQEQIIEEEFDLNDILSEQIEDQSLAKSKEELLEEVDQKIAQEQEKKKSPKKSSKKKGKKKTKKEEL